jgi:hypothetical protein
MGVAERAPIAADLGSVGRTGGERFTHIGAAEAREHEAGDEAVAGAERVDDLRLKAGPASRRAGEPRHRAAAPRLPFRPALPVCSQVEIAADGDVTAATRPSARGRPIEYLRSVNHQQLVVFKSAGAGTSW